MDDDESRQVVLITGCSEGGIGHALAMEFAANKCFVVATSRKLSSMSKDMEHDSTRFELKELDIRSDKSVNSVVKSVVDKFGKVDVLVNNAGVLCIGPLAELPLSVRFTFKVLPFTGALRMIQAVVPHMGSRRKGKIVNVGSTSALAPTPWSGAYTSSKSALHSLTDTLRLVNFTTLSIEVYALGTLANKVVECLSGTSTSPSKQLYWEELASLIV